MLLKELALIFSKHRENWPILNPSKGLPFPIRSFIRNFWGRSISADDFNKKNSPSRLGVFSRAFQNGDPLKTLSRSHLLRLNSLVTKMDESPGRKRILVLFHCYNNMTYSSPLEKVNKGQLAHSVCAILEEIHKSLAQTFTIKALNGNNFFEECKQYHKYFASYEKVYFLTDFLFNDADLSACSREVENIIKYFNLKKSIFFIIRDPLEYEKEAILNKDLQLLSWQDVETKEKGFNADSAYFVNLKKQVDDLQLTIKSTQNSCKLILGNHSILELLNFMNLELKC